MKLVSTWQSISEMTRLGSEATIIQLHAFILFFFVEPIYGWSSHGIQFFFEILKDDTDMK